MELETHRLILRDWHPSQDARHAMDIYGDARVMSWIDEGAKDTSIRQVEGRLQRYLDIANKGSDGTRSWAVEQKDIGRVIGHVILADLPDMKDVRSEQADAIPKTVDPDGMSTEFIEIGWHFRPASWGYGYATEAALRIAQYAFETLHLPVLLAVTDPQNRRSAGVMQRLGMRYGGTTTRYYGGKELFLYNLNAKDLAAAQAKWHAELAFLKALDAIEQQA